MLTFQFTHVIVLLAATFLIGNCHALPAIGRQDARPLCVSCGDDCNTKCEFGFITSTFCGIPQCRKGPGQTCGGPSDTWGVCGDGLICSCNRCTGCSVDNLTCFANTCLPYQSLESRNRHLDIFDTFPIDRIAK